MASVAHVVPRAPRGRVATVAACAALAAVPVAIGATLKWVASDGRGPVTQIDQRLVPSGPRVDLTAVGTSARPLAVPHPTVSGGNADSGAANEPERAGSPSAGSGASASASGDAQATPPKAAKKPPPSGDTINQGP